MYSLCCHLAYIATACYIFTKVMKPLVKFWWGNGIKIVVYLDDGIGAARGSRGTAKVSLFVKDTLGKAGFVIQP